MTSVYVKCDGCGAVVDRVPPGSPAGHPDGTFGKMGGNSARRYAESIGWTVGVGTDGAFPGDGGKDFCPECTAKRLAK